MVSMLPSLILVTFEISIFSRKICCQSCPGDDIIPEKYNKLQPPEPDGKSTYVYVFLQIMDLDEIEEATMDFRIHFFLGDIWKDHRLCLDAYKGQKMNILSEEHFKIIWKPDIIFENAKSGEMVKLSVPNTFIKILPDGTLYRATRYNLRISCRMDLQNYPMDTQHCTVSIASLAHPSSSMDMHWILEKGSPYTHMSSHSIKFIGAVMPLKFDVEPPRAVRIEEKWVSGNFTYLIANFTFIRSISSHVVNTYIPSTLVVMMSWMSFWLDVSVAPGRVTLGVTSLLTLATQGTRARSNLPAVSYMTALDVWLFICVLMVFASLVEYAVAYQIDEKRSKAEKAATSVTSLNKNPRFFSNVRRPSSSVNTNSTTSIRAANQRKVHKSSLIEKCKEVFRHSFTSYQRTNNKLDVFSRIAFPLFFSLFAACYWGHYYGFKSTIR